MFNYTKMLESCCAFRIRSIMMMMMIAPTLVHIRESYSSNGTGFPPRYPITPTFFFYKMIAFPHTACSIGGDRMIRVSILFACWGHIVWPNKLKLLSRKKIASNLRSQIQDDSRLIFWNGIVLRITTDARRLRESSSPHHAERCGIRNSDIIIRTVKES